MKKHRPVKHAHRKAMIAEKKAKGKYSRSHLPYCLHMCCFDCWAYYKDNFWKPNPSLYGDDRVHCRYNGYRF